MDVNTQIIQLVQHIDGGGGGGGGVESERERERVALYLRALAIVA